MSYINILVHCVWTTHKRIPCLYDEIRKGVIFHILENSRAKNIQVDHINGFREHLHALISLGGTQNISDIMHNIKGESSFWINKKLMPKERFKWQDDFYAVSIGMPQLDNLRRYIRNQPSHHTTMTWEEELELLEAEYKIKRFRD